MLIGYDPSDRNTIKFVNTDTRYLTRMERILGRPMNVSDFWRSDHGLVSLHLTSLPAGVPAEELVDRYRIEDGEVVPCDEQ